MKIGRVIPMKHLSNDLAVAVVQVRNSLKSKRIKVGIFDSVVDIERVGQIVNTTISKDTTGIYGATTANIQLGITYVIPTVNMVNQPESNSTVMNLSLLQTADDITLPVMMEAKLFGHEGKPSTIGVDKDTGDVYLVYLYDEELVLKQFGTLSGLDKSFVLNDDHLAVYYEFGVLKDALYKFITKDEGWNSLRKNMYIQFNLNPMVRLKVGATVDDRVN